MDLKIDPDDLNTCVQCGLCLPHCPTFRVTGDETLSPRGRIKLMREVQDNGAPVTEEVLDAFATCVQCRGCEPACPSGVPYGQLMEQARETLVADGRMTPWWQKLAMKPLANPRLLSAGTTMAALAARTGLVPDRFGLPGDIPLRSAPLEATGDPDDPTTVHFFTGCVMDTMQRDVHRAGMAVLAAAGIGAVPTGRAAPCCGALHVHAGLGDEARDLATETMDGLDDGRTIVVDSAGCGAAMKEYGHLLGSDRAEAFSGRVVDIAEFLAAPGDDGVAPVDRLPEVVPLDARVAVQDPCHLRHVQRVHAATRVVLRPFVRELVELDDDGLCCGAGGAYSVLEPELAGQIRDRKLGSIERAEPDVVASANPGCSMHLGAAGVPTEHPMTLVARAIDGTTSIDPA
ncbi:MAG: heterodisulfide reductase-related iron-sulfur binding cluster [Actinomycetota bacterium]